MALTDVLVGSIPAAEFMALMRQYPSVAEAVLVKLADLVRALSQRLYELSEPVPVRICTELIHMAEARSQDGRTARLRPPPKHADIASRLLTHREAVSRPLSDLRREGLVERGRGELVIRDIPRLREFAEELQGA